MKQTLLHAVMTCLLLFGVTSLVQAETKIYGLNYSSMGTSVAEVDLDAVNGETPTALTKSIEELGIEEPVAGTAVGNKYYALGYDPNTYAFGLYSVNFTTGKVVNIATYKIDIPGGRMTALCYDESTGTLYGAEMTYDEEENWFTALYSINPNNGNITKLATYDKKDVKALAADGKGGIYLVYNGRNSSLQTSPRIWYISTSTYEKTDFLMDSQTICKSTNLNSALLSADGNTLYYLTYEQLFAADLTAKTITKVGDLKSNLIGITYSKSTEDATPSTADKPKPVTRLLVSKTWYGDLMGTAPRDKDMKKEYYFYNYNYQVARVSKFGRTYNTNGTIADYQIMYYTKNAFNDNDQLTDTKVYQYGLYDFGDYAMKPSYSGNATYTYNEAGQMATMNDGSYLHTYTYDAEGNVATEEVTNANTGKWSRTYEYFDYVAPGKPGAVTSEGAYSSYTYNMLYTYDDNLNLIVAEKQTCTIDEEYGDMMPLTVQREEWTYEDNFLVRYTRYQFDKDGQPAPEFKIEYTMVDNNPDKVMATEYTSTDNGTSWYQQGIPYMSEYQEFGDDPAPTAMDVVAYKDAESLNTTVLNMSIPELAYENENLLLAIYRDGQPIDTVSVMEVLVQPEDFGMPYLEYRDAHVYNGTHDYFVQPMTGDVNNPSSLTGYLIPAPSEVIMDLDLPAVKDLALTSARKEKVGSGLTASTEKYGTFSWTNPEYPEEYQFISNSLMLNKAQAAESESQDPNCTSLEASIFTTTNVYVLTRYAYGKALSDTVTVTVSDLDKLIATGISSTTTAEGLQISYANSRLSLQDKANVSVFAINGELRMKEEQTESVDLSRLAKGSYMILVEKNGQVSALKVTK